MTNTTSQNPTPLDVSRQIDEHPLPNLTPGQQALMAGEIKSLVHRLQPTSKTEARQALTGLSRFVRDVAPTGGCPLAEVLTDQKLNLWVHNHRSEFGAGRNLGCLVGTLRRVLRVHKGLPARVRVSGARRVSAPPLSASDFHRLLDACVAEDGGAWRAFAACFGSGVPAAAAMGGTFVVADGLTELRLHGGSVHRVVSTIASAGRLGGREVLDGDWQELQCVATGLRIHLQSVALVQTFRECVLSECGSLQSLMATYGLTCAHLQAILPHLGAVDIDGDVASAELLRG